MNRSALIRLAQQKRQQPDTVQRPSDEEIAELHELRRRVREGEMPTTPDQTEAGDG